MINQVRKKYSRLIIQICVMSFVCLSLGRAETLNVTSVGLGKDRQEALDSALREAVSQTLGSLIISETQINNNQVIKDKILSYSSGYVAKYEILNEAFDANNKAYTILVKAQINKEIIKKKLVSYNILEPGIEGPLEELKLITNSLRKVASAKKLLIEFVGYKAAWKEVLSYGTIRGNEGFKGRSEIFNNFITEFRPDSRSYRRVSDSGSECFKEFLNRFYDFKVVGVEVSEYSLKQIKGKYKVLISLKQTNWQNLNTLLQAMQSLSSNQNAPYWLDDYQASALGFGKISSNENFREILDIFSHDVAQLELKISGVLLPSTYKMIGLRGNSFLIGGLQDSDYQEIVESKFSDISYIGYNLDNEFENLNGLSKKNMPWFVGSRVFFSIPFEFVNLTDESALAVITQLEDIKGLTIETAIGGTRTYVSPEKSPGDDRISIGYDFRAHLGAGKTQPKMSLWEALIFLILIIGAVGK